MISEIRRDFYKLALQLLGKENMFGYRSTIANQLYLAYCFVGFECYRTKKLTSYTKLMVAWWQCYEVLFMFTGIGSYIIFADKNDFLLCISIWFPILLVLFVRVVIPFTTLLNHQSLMQMIDNVDEIVARTPPTGKNANLNFVQLYGRQYVIFNVMQIMYCVVCPVDLILFYDEAKLKDYLYYFYPLPQIEIYGNMNLFVITDVLSAMGVPLVNFEIASHCAILLTCSVICQNEVFNITDHLNANTRQFSAQVQVHRERERECERDATLRFQRALNHCVILHQKLHLLIRQVKGFYTTICTVGLSFYYVFCICHVYNMFDGNISIAIKIRESIMTFNTLAVTYHYFMLADASGSEMVDNMSFLLYSTPWYRSTALRKHIHIFLCQVQYSVALKAMSVYPLIYAAYLRFLNHIYSTVNVLRTIIR